MAANLWRGVLGVQALLALALATASRAFLPGTHLLAVCVIAVAAFLALQYLGGLLIIILSRSLAPSAARRPRHVDALRAGLSEPLCFALAEFAMARGALAPFDAGHGAAGRGPLLLVHGLACNSGLWRLLRSRLRAAGFARMRAVDLEPMGGDIDSLARQLRQAIEESFRQNGNLPVTLLAHSLGGLVCRAALRDLDPRLVRQLVTIATPHHGAALARLLRTPPVNQMRPDSPWLVALNSAPPATPAVPITSIYSLDDNFVTPATSAELGAARLHALRGLGHFGLLVAPRAADCVLRALREPA